MPRQGYTHSAETKAKISASKRGRPNGLAGSTQSDETKLKKSLLLKGIPGRSGWHHTEETKRKISESLTGQKRTEETKQRMRDAKKKQVSVYEIEGQDEYPVNLDDLFYDT